MIKLIQIIWYGYFRRINLLTQCLIEYNCLDTKYDILYFNLWIVYFMGISWWIIQNYKFYKENKIYEKIKYQNKIFMMMNDDSEMYQIELQDDIWTKDENETLIQY